MSATYQCYGVKGRQTYAHGLDVAVSAVTVNGASATFTDNGSAVTISSPTINGGESIVFSESVNETTGPDVMRVQVTNFPPASSSSSSTANQYPGSDYAKDGTDASGVTAPSGGVGIRGWLSGIYSKLSGTITVSWSGQSVALAAGTAAIGSISNSTFGATQSGAWSVGVTGAVTIGAGSATIGAISNTSFAATQSGTWSMGISGSVALGAGSATIGSIANTSFAATQSGSWAVSATQSGSWTVGISGSVVLGAGSATIGAISNTSFAATQSGTWSVGVTGAVTLGAGSAKVGIFTTDQTTHGTTDKVAADLFVAGSPNAVSNAAFAFIGQYTSSLLGLAANQAYYPALDQTRHLSTSPTGSADPMVGIAPSFSTAATAAQQIKNGPGNLYGLNVCAGGTAGYIMLFDATSVPADGTVTPKWVMPIAANAGWNGSPAGTNIPMNFTTGILAVFSSTGPFTKTASATAFISGSAR